MEAAGIYISLYSLLFYDLYLCRRSSSREGGTREVRASVLLRFLVVIEACGTKEVNMHGLERGARRVFYSSQRLPCPGSTLRRRVI